MAKEKNIRITSQMFPFQIASPLIFPLYRYTVDVTSDMVNILFIRRQNLDQRCKRGDESVLSMCVCVCAGVGTREGVQWRDMLLIRQTRSAVSRQAKAFGV